MNKRIVPTIECFPNYIFHVLAIAKINFEGGYADRYRNSISRSDIDFLSDHKNLLHFYGPESTSFVYPFIFLPSYISPSSSDEVYEYYELLLNAVKTMDGADFINHYKEYFDRHEKWTYKGAQKYLEYLLGYLNHEHLHETEKLVEVFKNNYAAYVRKVWPEEMPRLQRAGSELAQSLEAYDLIRSWEELTNREFQFPEYQIVLCSAAENGPDMNSLGYERNLFYAFTDTKNLVRNIGHEVGTHIMIDCYDLWTPERSELFYEAYESLARYYNRKLFEDISLQSWPLQTTPKFMEIYGKLEAGGDIGDNCDPKNFLAKAMDLMEVEGRTQCGGCR